MDTPAKANMDNATNDAVVKLHLMRQEVAECRLCRISCIRTHTVYGEGAPYARILFIGEAPGRTEDRTGRPYGVAGPLDDGLKAAGWLREQVYITYLVKCQTPSGRQPTPAEIGNCRPFALAQIDVIKPRIVVAMGRLVAVSLGLIGVDKSLSIGPGTFEKRDAYITYDPGYVARNASIRDAWLDSFREMHRMLDVLS